ncbi:MAG: Vitamin B12 transporter BtuB [Candidatus Aminicenantes bacterium ADurb.Bin508]|nr:MAG: Vitamin B12 transporter BtuB [Candidatus Aminicenantes bacterium ADurb.Bin508]
MVNTALSYEPLPSVRLFARIDNLLDKTYCEAWGYGTPGFSLYGGVRFSF